jgi:probable rRNA maturation factor
VSSVTVEIANFTRFALDRAAVARLAGDVLTGEGVMTGELGVRFVGERRMHALNRDHLGHDEVTDVLAFPLEHGDELPVGAAGPASVSGSDGDEADDAAARAVPRLLGDVVVCPRRAAAQARAAGTPLAFELAMLLVHGTLHVLGYDHEADAGAMALRQARYLNDASWEHLLGRT